MKNLKKFNENSEDVVTISKNEYLSLLNDSNFLLCLQGAGVDNWDGYDDACDNYTELTELVFLPHF